MQRNKFVLTCALIAWVGSAAIAASGEAQSVSVVRVPQGGEPIAVQIASDGTIHLLYNSGDIPYYVKSSDGGASFSAPLPVVNEGARRPELKFEAWSLALGKAGAIHVAMSTNNWQVKLPDVPVGFVYATLPPRGNAFTPVRSLNEKPSEGFSITADGQGRVAATWLSGKLYANFSGDDGRTFSPNEELNPSYDPCNCCTTRSVYNPNGDLAILYREESNDDRDMHLVIRNQSGRLTRTRISSTPWRVNACPMTYYALTSTKEGYLAAWPTKGEIYFARVDRTGAVLPPGEVKTPGRSGMRTGLVALSGPDGSTLIAWKRDGELSWQLYDARGVAQGGVKSVPSAGKGAAGVTNRFGKFILFE